MKNFLKLLMISLCLIVVQATLLPAVQAQTVISLKPTADTLVNTDTAVVTTSDIPDGWQVALQATARRVTGTLAGKVYIQHTLNGVDYITIDSLTLTNVPRASKVFTITAPAALRYRAQYISSGSVRYLPELYVFRRR